MVAWRKYGSVALRKCQVNSAGNTWNPLFCNGNSEASFYIHKMTDGITRERFNVADGSKLSARFKTLQSQIFPESHLKMLTE